MGFIVHAIVSVAKSAAQLTEDAVQAAIKAGTVVAGLTVKLGGVVLKAASPVTKIYAGAMKFALDNTLGRVLPISIYGKISSFTNAGAAIAEGNLKPSNFRDVVKGFVDIALIEVRISNMVLTEVEKTSIGKGLNKYTGGLLTSFHTLGSVAIVLETNTLAGGHEKIDWKKTLMAAISVAAAVASGGTAVAIMAATNVVGEETGLNKTALGSGLLTAAVVASGSADFSSGLEAAAVSGGTQLGTKALINNTALGQTELGRDAATLGVNVSAGMINDNAVFSDVLKNDALSMLKSVVTKQVIKDLTPKRTVATRKPIVRKTVVKRVPVKNTIKKIQADGTVKVVETGTTSMAVVADAVDLSAYETIDEIIQEAKDFYTSEIKNLGNVKIDALTENNLCADADHVILKRMEDVYGFTSLYGEKLATFVLFKYGPKEDYSHTITPDDYLNYQITNYKETDRLTKVVYSKKPKVNQRSMLRSNRLAAKAALVKKV